MNLEFNFAADRVIQRKGYPALATWPASPYTPAWRQFRYHWPYTVPCELHEHCVTHGVEHKINSVDHSSPGDFYTIGLGFFDFDIDYFSLIPPQVFEKKLQILFYYHEGDNPYRIKNRLDALCGQHKLDRNCYRFVSGNTRADRIKNFAWFPDHELLYWHRNREVLPCSIHLNSRPYKFTVLNRTHKWWRATVMADLKRTGILDQSLWSYNTELTSGDSMQDNPIEIDVLNLRSGTEQFVAQGPYCCDNLTADQHNDHHLHVADHYVKSYCHIVVETHFDADQSGGAFLTEKTFKPIKHGQPFVIVGAPGSLRTLRKLGYRTFDHAIDNSYDEEKNNTLRWKKLLDTIKQINQQDPDQWLAKCLDDLCHNQKLFLSSKRNRLNTLLQKLKKK